MREALLDILRCPFCGSRLATVDNEELVRVSGRLESGVLGCDCCAFPVVAGIPVMIASDTARDAMHQLERGRSDDALLTLLGLDGKRAAAFLALNQEPQGPTYKRALAILCQDAEADYFLYR